MISQPIKVETDQILFSFSARKVRTLTGFGQFRFRTKMHLAVFVFFRFRPKSQLSSEEIVHLDSLQSIWQRPSKHIKWATSLTFVVTVDGY